MDRISSLKENYSGLLQELEKRKDQYSFIEIKGVIYFEDNTWKNVVTKICPRACWEANVQNPYEHHYGDIIIFSKGLDFEGIIKIIGELRDKGKISLGSLEYEVPKDIYRETVVSSYRNWGGFMFEWPSIFYVTMSQQAMRSSPLDKTLARSNLPYYPYLRSAIEKEIGIKPGHAQFGKVIMIVPDYRARIALNIISKSKVKAKLDTKIENPKNLLGKYYCVTEKEVHQGDIIFEENEKEIEFQDEIKEFYICLLTKEDELIDRKDFYSHYPTEPGVSIEYTPENIEFIIKGGENEYVEFKEKISKNYKEFVKSIVAFANKNGGTVFLGVDDDCNIVGAIPEDKEKERIYSIVRDNCEPAIEINLSIVTIYDKELVLINVPEGKDKPYFVKDKGPYIRVGGSDRVMTRTEFDQVHKARVLHYTNVSR